MQLDVVVWWGEFWLLKDNSEVVPGRQAQKAKTYSISTAKYYLGLTDPLATSRIQSIFLLYGWCPGSPSSKGNYGEATKLTIPKCLLNDR